jgi:ketosteroid isomerase-like protein
MGASKTLEAMKALALRLLHASETYDIAEIEAIFHPNAQVWHNTDQVVLSWSENLKDSEIFVRALPNKRYVDVKITPFEGGYIQQHRVVGESLDGKPFDLPSCLIFQVKKGRIVRMDEYFDSAPFLGVGIKPWLPKA